MGKLQTADPRLDGQEEAEPEGLYPRVQTKKRSKWAAVAVEKATNRRASTA